MIFKILTLFPEVLVSYLNSSIIGRAIKENKISVHVINFRDYSKGKHKKVDEKPYGGGAGMLLSCEPLYNAIKNIRTKDSKIIFLTPNGVLFNQKKALELSLEKEIILICGFYEGFDKRIFELIDHEKISIGDFILTNGGLAGLIILDVVSRIYNNVLNNSISLLEESFNDNLLEYDQYTRPAEYKGLKVPDVLLKGNHTLIKDYKRKSSLTNTLRHRPDLISKVKLSIDDLTLLISCIEK